MTRPGKTCRWLARLRQLRRPPPRRPRTCNCWTTSRRGRRARNSPASMRRDRPPCARSPRRSAASRPRRMPLPVPTCHVRRPTTAWNRRRQRQQRHRKPRPHPRPHPRPWSPNPARQLAGRPLCARSPRRKRPPLPSRNLPATCSPLLASRLAPCGHPSQASRNRRPPRQREACRLPRSRLPTWKGCSSSPWRTPPPKSARWRRPRPPWSRSNPANRQPPRAPTLRSTLGRR